MVGYRNDQEISVELINFPALYKIMMNKYVGNVEQSATFKSRKKKPYQIYISHVEFVIF